MINALSESGQSENEDHSVTTVFDDEGKEHNCSIVASAKKSSIINNSS